jgi:hypothetical protein
MRSRPELMLLNLTLGWRKLNNNDKLYINPNNVADLSKKNGLDFRI